MGIKLNYDASIYELKGVTWVSTGFIIRNLKGAKFVYLSIMAMAELKSLSWGLLMCRRELVFGD